MRLFSALPVIFCLALGLDCGAAQAQQVAFGGLRTDPAAQVEVTADSLAVNQADGSAVFTGNVIIVQGALRLQAAQVRVEYGNAEKSRISRLHASGGVTLVTEAEAAEAHDAVYDVGASSVVMTGDVLLTQAENVLSGQRLTVDLKTGTGQMDGRVRTILQPGQQP
jgi:lipopolysaccharide export system protein LptA